MFEHTLDFANLTKLNLFGMRRPYASEKQHSTIQLTLKALDQLCKLEVYA